MPKIAPASVIAISFLILFIDLNFSLRLLGSFTPFSLFIIFCNLALSCFIFSKDLLPNAALPLPAVFNAVPEAPNNPRVLDIGALRIVTSAMPFLPISVSNSPKDSSTSTANNPFSFIFFNILGLFLYFCFNNSVALAICFGPPLNVNFVTSLVAAANSGIDLITCSCILASGRQKLLIESASLGDIIFP